VHRFRTLVGSPGFGMALHILLCVMNYKFCLCSLLQLDIFWTIQFLYLNKWNWIRWMTNWWKKVSFVNLSAVILGACFSVWQWRGMWLVLSLGWCTVLDCVDEQNASGCEFALSCPHIWHSLLLCVLCTECIMGSSCLSIYMFQLWNYMVNFD